MKGFRDSISQSHTGVIGITKEEERENMESAVS